MTNENSFSLITERVGAQDGSVNHFARNDFRVFRALFHYDFSAVEGFEPGLLLPPSAITRPLPSTGGGTTKTSVKRSGT